MESGSEEDVEEVMTPERLVEIGAEDISVVGDGVEKKCWRRRCWRRRCWRRQCWRR